MPTQNDPIAPAVGSMQRDFERETSTLEKIGVNPLQAGTLKPTDLYEATYTPEELAQLSEYQSLLGKKQGFEAAKESLLATPRPTVSGMRILERGLKAKGNIGQEELGESELFKKAGLSGYAVLSQSLAQRGQEIEQKYQSFASELNNVSTAFKDTFNLAVDKYNILKGAYDEEVVRFQAVVDDLVAHEQSIAYLQEQNRLSKELASWKAGLDGAGPGSGTYGKDYSSVYGGGTWDSPVVQGLSTAFIPPEASPYRGVGEWECGEAYNDFTDGPKVGDDWSSKMAAITKRDNPVAGNGLMIPWGGTTYGHAGTVLDYDKNTGTVYTVEYNHNGDGKQTFEQYTIKELNDAYGDDWGFTDSTLKSDFKAQLDSLGGNKPPEWMDTYIKDYVEGSITQSQVNTKIEKRPELSAKEKDYYQTMFDNLIGTKVKSGKIEELVGKAGTTIEELPAPLNTVLAGIAEGESPQEEKERIEINYILSDPAKIEEYTEALKDLDIDLDDANLVKTKIKNNLKEAEKIDLTPHQLDLLYAALTHMKDK